MPDTETPSIIVPLGKSLRKKPADKIKKPAINTASNKFFNSFFLHIARIPLWEVCAILNGFFTFSVFSVFWLFSLTLDLAARNAYLIYSLSEQHLLGMRTGQNRLYSLDLG